MAYRTLTLPNRPTAPTLPDPGAVPLTATSPQVPHASLLALDTLMGSGGRVLFHTGLLGGDSFTVPSGTDPESASPHYFNKSTWRVVARGNDIPITPGSFPWLEVIALPSGPMQLFGTIDAVTGYFPDGAGGDIKLEVVYTNGDAQTTTVVATVTIPASGSEFAAEPPAPWFSLVVKEATAMPNTIQQLSVAWWHRWTRGEDVVIDYTLSYRGSPRPIDVAIVERPLSIVTDTTDSRWPTAMYSKGDPLESPPTQYPISQFASADPALGTASIRRALYGHGRLLGPCLVWWSSADEHISSPADWSSYFSGTGDNEAPPWTMTGATPTLLGSDGLTAESANNFGWRLGHYARQAGHGDEFLDGRTGVLPVWVSCYGKVSSGAASITLKTDTAGWGDVSLRLASSSYTWVRQPAWIEVGTGPEDAPVARVWVSAGTTSTVSVRAFAVHMRQD